MTPTHKKLTTREAAFVRHYLGDAAGNGAKAAILAGYSSKGAKVAASKLLTKVNVRAVLANLTQKVDAQHDVDAAKTQRQLVALGFRDVREFFDAAGNLKPIQELSDRAAACIAGFEVIKKNAAAGDGHTDTVHKIRLVDPVRPLEVLAKRFGLLREQLEVSGGLTIKHELGDGSC